MYATAQDLQERFPATDLKQLTDIHGEVIDSARLDTALRDASAEIDGYLQARYPLPLPVVPAHLVTLACNIAMYRLQAGRNIEKEDDVRTRYSDAVKYLERVNAGTLQLGVATLGDQAVPQSAGVEIVTGERHFTRGSMRGL